LFAAVSVTTVELSLAGEGTQLVLTEQATVLDDALGAELVR